MTDGGPQAEGSVRLEELATALDALSRDVRKVGRAAIAAQSAAETTQLLVETRLADASAQNAAAAAPQLAERKAPGEAPTDASLRQLVERLLPVFDAVHRAAEMTPQRRGPLAFLRGRGTTDGLRLLRDRLEDALAGSCLEVIAPHSGPVDASAHRVLEVRRQGGVPPGHVVQLLRRGYRLQGRLLREAEVVATPAPSESKDGKAGEPA